MKIKFDVVDPSKNGIGFGMQYSPRISITFDEDIAWTWTDSEEFDYYKDAKERAERITKALDDQIDTLEIKQFKNTVNAFLPS